MNGLDLLVSISYRAVITSKCSGLIDIAYNTESLMNDTAVSPSPV